VPRPRLVVTAVAVALLAGCPERGNPPAAGGSKAGSTGSDVGSAATTAADQPAPAAAAGRPVTLAHVTIKAIGMNCPESCPLQVRTALAKVPAVYQIGFDLDHEAVLVSYDQALGSARDVTAPMLAAIKGAGYDPWLASEAWSDEHPPVEVIVHDAP
jgi:copper chaperone CopZ